MFGKIKNLISIVLCTFLICGSLASVQILAEESASPKTAAEEAAFSDASSEEASGQENTQTSDDPVLRESVSEEAADEETQKTMQQQEEAAGEPAFFASQEMDGATVCVAAPEGVFPEGAVLSVQSLDSGNRKAEVDAAVEEKRPSGTNVVSSYTFDIKILNASGEEIQPSDAKEVQISFSLPEVENQSLSTDIYHIKEGGRSLAAESLSVTTEGDTATVTTDSFSCYTVEFTYNDNQYVLEGGKAVKLEDVLASLGIRGEVTGCKVSDPSLFDVLMGDEKGVSRITRFSEGETKTIPVNNPKGNVRYLVSLQPFTSEEWMDVIADGITYRIVVTDAIMDDGALNENVSGLSQGSGTDFASAIPVGDIWIDQTKVSTSVESRNLATFIPGDLMNNNPGFILFEPSTENGYENADGTKVGHAGYKGDRFVEFDTTKQPLDGSYTTTRKDDGTTVYQSYNRFDGTVGSFKWEDAAVRINDQGREEYLDVYIEYANPMITIETEQNAQQAGSLNNAVIGLFSGNMVTLGGQQEDGTITNRSPSLRTRYGLDIEIRPYIKDKSGNLVQGKFYFPMVHLNVDRSENSGYKKLFGADPDYNNYDESLHSYSEQVKLEKGLVQNSDGDIVYIPGAEGDDYHYFSQIDYNNGVYTVFPGHTASPESIRSTFYLGFLTLVENGDFSFTYNAASGSGARRSIETYVLAGTEFNYRLQHTTETLKSADAPNPGPDTGGTIHTTRMGNHSGKLDDGEKIEPSIIATASGQTIVYTFIPKPGYGIRELWIINGGHSLVERDEHGEAKRDAAGKYILNPAATKITEGNGPGHYQAHDDDGDGTIDRYTFEFSRINSDNAIHVIWGKSILQITKRTYGSGDVPDQFKFRIRSWGVPDGETQTQYVDFATASSDPEQNQRFTPVPGEEGVYEFVLTNNETLNIAAETIPVGYQWEVEEIAWRTNGAGAQYGKDNDGWIPVGTTKRSGTFESRDIAYQANFANSRKQDIPAEKKLTVKKVWANDTEVMRPKTLTVTITKSASRVYTRDLKNAINNIVPARDQVLAIKTATPEQYRNTSNAVRLNSMPAAGEPAYIWYQDQTIYLYSEGDIYLSGETQGMFQNMTNLSDISGLANVRTDYVTSMAYWFESCFSLQDLSPLASWQTGNVKNMTAMFAFNGINGNNYQSSHMTYEDIDALANWNTQNVTTFNQMFKGSSLRSVAPLAIWNVGSATNLNQMFFRTQLGENADLRDLDSWDISRVAGNNFKEIFGRSVDMNNYQGNGVRYPNWQTQRGGTWNGAGTYTPSTGPASGPNPNIIDLPPEPADYTTLGQTQSRSVHDVDDSDSNVWIYEFEVEPDGSTWSVYEMLPNSEKEFYVCSWEDENGTLFDGRGMKADPVTGATAGSVTTLVNTRKTTELVVKKNTDIPTEDRFSFTLTLWSGTTEMANPYNLPDDYPLLLDHSLTKVADGTYTFRLGAPATEELMLPMGIRYRVTEESAAGWSLISDHNTHGVLNTRKEAFFLNSRADLLKVLKIWEGDSYDNAIIKNRPKTAESLGIVVTTVDQTVAERWNIANDRAIKTVSSSDPDFTELASLYEASSVTPEICYKNSAVVCPLTAAKLIIRDGERYALDKISETQFKLIPIVDGSHKGSRWKVNGDPETIHNTNTEFGSIDTIYAASNLTPEVMDAAGTGHYHNVVAPHLVEYRNKDYVFDRINNTEYRIYPVTNLPFEKTYTSADVFLPDDNADTWLYEYNIPQSEDVISVHETRVPEYYEKTETSEDENGEIVYKITNRLKREDLTVKKETLDNEPGRFSFGIKFWVETDTSERHPVKIGHSHFQEEEDGEGNKTYDYEFVFEDGVTLNGKNVYGLHEKIGDVVYSLPNSGLAGDKVTDEEGNAILETLRTLRVGEADAEFTRYKMTNLQMSDLGLQWYGNGSFAIYVEQEASVAENMFTNGRRLDWFIIPTPDQELITVRKPFALDGVEFQKPDGVLGVDGTYYFDLQNGGSISFGDLPVGVGYDIVEIRKAGWQQTSVSNKAGETENILPAELTTDETITFTNRRENGNIRIIKKTEQDEAGVFTFRAMTGRVIRDDQLKDQDGNPISFTRIYPDYQGGKSEALLASVVERSDHVEYETVYGDCYMIYSDRVLFKDRDAADYVQVPAFNLVYPYQYTTQDGMNYCFTYTVDRQTGVLTGMLDIESTVIEFDLENNTASHNVYAEIQGIPFGSRDRIWEVLPEGCGWELVSVDGDAQKQEVNAILNTDQTVTHEFLNDRKEVSLTIGKEVSGNQGSKDKYFKYEVTLENVGERTMHLDLTNAEKLISGEEEETPNPATIYRRSEINTYNNRDDDRFLKFKDASPKAQLHCGWTDGVYLYQWDAENLYWIRTDPEGNTDTEHSPPPDASRAFTHGSHINSVKNPSDPDDTGSVTFYVFLQHGQSVTLEDIPFGASYTVTEVNEDYKPGTSVTGDVRTGEVRDADNRMTEGTELWFGYGLHEVSDSCLREDTQILFTNKRNGVVPTEIFFGWLTWIVLLIAASGYGVYRFGIARRRKGGR